MKYSPSSPSSASPHRSICGLYDHVKTNFTSINSHQILFFIGLIITLAIFLGKLCFTNIYEGEQGLDNYPHFSFYSLKIDLSSLLCHLQRFIVSTLHTDKDDIDAWSKTTSKYGTLHWKSPNEENCRSMAFLFSITCLYSTLNVVFSSLEKKRLVSASATAIHVLACLSYILMSNSWIPVVTVENGRKLVLGRVLEWSITVPFFVILLVQLVNTPVKQRCIHWVPIKQFMAMLIGGFSPLWKGNYRWLVFLFASYLQIGVLLYIHKLMLIMYDNIQAKRDRKLIRSVHYITMCLFLFYPIIWCLGIMTNIIEEETEALLFSVLDFVTKFLFTSILCNLSAQAYDYDLLDYSAHFWKFVKILQVPVFALDESGRITHWNQHMAYRTKLEGKEIIKTRIYKWKNMFGKESIQQISNILTSVLLGEGQTQEKLDILFHTDLKQKEILSANEGKTISPLSKEERKMKGTSSCLCLALNKKIRFNIFVNRMEGLEIPTLIFVGSIDEKIDHGTFLELRNLLQKAYHESPSTLNSNNVQLKKGGCSSSCKIEETKKVLGGRIL